MRNFLTEIARTGVGNQQLFVFGTLAPMTQSGYSIFLLETVGIKRNS